MVQHGITGKFPRHPDEILALTDGDGQFWPVNPYTGAKVRIFTPADGTLEDVFSRDGTRGDVYWEYGSDGTLEWADIYIFTPLWDAGEKSRRFAVNQDAWPATPVINKSGTLFKLRITSDSAKLNGLPEKRMKMRKDTPDPYGLEQPEAAAAEAPPPAGAG